MALSLDASLTVEHPPSEGPAPGPAPLDMPTQDLGRAPSRPPARLGARVTVARLISVGGAAVLTAYGCRQMTLVFGNETSTPLQLLLLVLFTVTFGWVAFSASQAVAALLAPRPRSDAHDNSRLTGRTAIIMPVYNEDPAATTARLFAMGDGLSHAGHGDAFEIFILSDTNDPTIWLRETAAFSWLRDALAGRMRVWYRRRRRNTGRKAGNVRDFVERWGGRYDHMLVLDADSLMEPVTIVRMCRRMEAAPRLGILQTVPMPIGGKTLFARLQQFAGRLYGPVVARGVAAWQGLDGNYWGHNALIRVRAFAENCGLPELPGQKPFGGHVLSHDFVEAALIRRGGWHVRMDPDLEGSWEGPPPSLLDFAVRDRRWAQGNLQHSKVIGARGLTLANRMHFLIGIGSYLMSPIWLALLLTGAMLTGQSLVYERKYFSDGPQLFPDWPVFDADRMIFLFALSLGLLLLPKLMGVVRALVISQVRRHSGGSLKILCGALLELVLSALFAPVLMLMQIRQLAEILCGRDSGWVAQRRDGDVMPWREAFAKHGWQTVAGIVPAVLLAWLAPGTLAWLSPVLVGWLLAPALSRISGDSKFGPVGGILAAPEETERPAIAVKVETLRSELEKVTRVELSDLTRDSGCYLAHTATLTPSALAERSDEAALIDAITARAKIEAATDLHQALHWMDTAETVALLSSTELLALLAGRFGSEPPSAVARLRALA